MRTGEDQKNPAEPGADQARLARFVRWSAETTPTKRRMSATPMRFSRTVGGNTSTYPASLTKAEKLETQKGIKNSLKICHRSSVVVPLADDFVLIIRAAPMMALTPRDVSQSRGRASKCRETLVTYQMA
jgi:hypothetical protein